MIKFRQPIDLGGLQVTSVGEPSGPSDAVTKAYADGILGDVSPATPLPVRLYAEWSAGVQPALTNVAYEVVQALSFGGYMIYNPNTVAAFVQVFDAFAAAVTVGTTAADYVLSVPPGSAANLELTCGVAHDVAITVAATAGPGSDDALASPLVCTFFYR